MTWKAGDSVSLPIILSDNLGNGLAYATATAFTAAGWSLSWVQGSVALATQPTFTLLPDPSGQPGVNFVTFSLPAGVTTLEVIPPAGSGYFASKVEVLVVCANDEDSLAANFTRGTVAVTSPATTSALPDQPVTEGDAFAFPLPALPTGALSFYVAGGVTTYSTLADIGGQPWTVACQARRTQNNGELPAVAPAFSLLASIVSKTGNTLVVGWDTPPVGAQIDDTQATGTAVLTAQALTSITLVTGGCYFGGNIPTVAITGGSGTGAAATAIVVNGVVTGFTVTAPGSGYTGTPTITLSTPGDGTVPSRRFLCDVQLVPPSGSTFATSKITVFSFAIVINRQQTTSP